MEYSKVSKNELMNLLATAYQFLSDEKKLQDQIATINRRAHQIANKPVGFQNFLRWGIPVLAFLAVFTLTYGILGSAISVIGGAVAAYFAYNYSSGKKDKALAKDKVVQYRQLATRATGELETYQSSNEFLESLDGLSADMCDLYSVAALYNILETGRADTWKEAINKFDTEAHRYREEQNQQAMINNQQRQLQEAERNNILLNRVQTNISAQNALIATQMVQIENISRHTSSISSDVNNMKNR